MLFPYFIYGFLIGLFLGLVPMLFSKLLRRAL